MTRYLLIPVIPKKMFLFSTHYDPPFSKVTHFKLIIIFIKLNYVDECPCVIERQLYMMKNFRVQFAEVLKLLEKSMPIHLENQILDLLLENIIVCTKFFQNFDTYSDVMRYEGLSEHIFRSMFKRLCFINSLIYLLKHFRLNLVVYCELNFIIENNFALGLSFLYTLMYLS